MSIAIIYHYNSFFLFFFFKQKTAYEMRISDWSSDVCSSDLAAAIADALPGNGVEAALLAPDAVRLDSLDALLEQPLDGIVIATPSALHAEQSIRALERGVPVFCQKPLGRTGAEVRAVIDAARAADRLLGVDLSYRGTAGMRALRDHVRAGQLGQVHAVDLIFHNAYGPDKPWFHDPLLSGGDRKSTRLNSSH